MLHIVTPLFRPKLLNYVYNSIPKHEDITWHISFIKNVNISNFDFLNDKRIKLYELDCSDNDTISKRNAAFEKIKNGYFHLLDDDTEFKYKMYEKYKYYSEKNYVGMVIGSQERVGGKIRLKANFPPTLGHIDSGNVLCHWSVLEHIKWGANPKNNKEPKDFYFWKRVYGYFGKCEITEDVISTYNSLKRKFLLGEI